MFVLKAGYLAAGVLILVVNGGVGLAEALGGPAPLEQRHHRADGDEYDEDCSQGRAFPIMFHNLIINDTEMETTLNKNP